MPIWQRWNLFLNRPVRILSKPLRVALWLVLPCLTAEWAFAWSYTYKRGIRRRLKSALLVVLRFVALVSVPSVKRYRSYLESLEAQPNAPPPQNRIARRAAKEMQRLGKMKPNYWRSIRAERVEAVHAKTWVGRTAELVAAVMIALPLLMGVSGSHLGTRYNEPLFAPAQHATHVMQTDPLDPQSVLTVATYVSSFQKIATATTQDITITQDMTTGVAAGMFWSAGVGAVSGTYDANIAGCIGLFSVNSGTVVNYSGGVTCDDGVTTPNSARRSANKALTLPTTSGGGTQWEADVSFTSSTNMRLTWSTNVGGTERINFMLITGLTAATVVRKQAKTTAGLQAYTGVGFSPDAVLMFMLSDQTTLASTSHGRLAFGMMNKAGQQGGNGFGILDGSGVSSSSNGKVQQTDAAFAQGVQGPAIYNEASFQAMGADGFTLDWVTTGGAYDFYALCLGGCSTKIGSFVSTASSPQTITTSNSAGFTVRGAILSNLTAAPTGASSGVQFSIGASDGTNQRSSALLDRNGVATTVTKSIYQSASSLVAPSNSGAVANYELGTVTFSTTTMTATWGTAGGGVEYLYFLIGDAGTNTFPSMMPTASSITNILATAYSNQKHAVTLSTGRMVMVASDTGANAKFVYSDDGITGNEVDYGVPVGGWANGSTDAYVDSGGTERLVAVWKQSGTSATGGTGGARTSGECYAMVGSFNAGRTTLTWGAAISLNIGSASRSYPDVRVTADGTGGLGLAVKSTNNGAGTNRVDTNVLTINSSGTLSVAAEVAGANYGQSVDTFPSVDINPSTKDLFVAWSAGTTGTGKGVRFQRYAYSAGTWAPQTEVEVSPTYYINASDNEGIVCRWDGTRAVILGYVYDGTNRKIEIWDSTSFTSFTNRVDSLLNYSASAGLLGFGATIDAATGDCYLVGSNFSSTYNNVNYYRVTRSGTSLSLGSPVASDPFAGTTDAPHVYAWYSGSTIRWIYTRGNNAPYALTYDQIVLANPLPTGLSPTNGSTVTTDVPTLGLTMTSGGLQKAEWNIASDSGFTTGLRDIVELDAALTTSGAHTLVLPNASSLITGTWYIRGRAVSAGGTNPSAWTSTNTFTVSHPGSSSGWSPTGGSTLLWNVAGNTLGWSFSSTSPLDSITAYQIIVERNSDGLGLINTGKTSSTTNPGTYNAVISGTYKDVDLRWKIQTWNRDDVTGGYSSYNIFRVADAPTITMTAPANLSTVTTPQPTATFSFTAGGGRTIASALWTIVRTSDSHVMGSSPYSTGAGVSSMTPGTPILANTTQYTETVVVTDSAGLSNTASTTYTTAWTPPTAPTFVVTP